MFRDLFDKGKCALGFHAGEWQYVAGGRCDQIRVCSRCKNESRQVVHVWQEWRRLEKGQCDFARQCSRCATSEKKTEHAWGDAIYPNEQSCQMVQPCTGCTNTKPADTVHTWTAWTYDSAEACAQTSACARCGAAGGAKRISHEWNAAVASEFYRARVQVCRRCAEMVFDGLGQAGTAAPSMQAAAVAVSAAMRSGEATALRRSIQTHRDVLLGPVTEKYLAYAADQLAADADEREAYETLGSLLARCRREGLDAVLPPPASAAASTHASHAATPRPATSPRAVAGPPGAPPPTVEAAGRLDPRLSGHWRHTEAISGFTTDTHCVLDTAGRFAWWRHSVTTFGESRDGPEHGAWHVDGGWLHLAFDSGRRLDADYQTDGASMVWRNHGTYRFWEHLR